MIEKENSCHLQISGAAAPGVRDQSVLFLLLFSEWVSEDSSFVVLLWWWQWRWRWLFLFFLLIQKFSWQSTVPHSQQPTLSPGLSSTLFFPKNKVEDANDETEAKADPGQYEAVAVVRTYQCYLAHRLTVCEPSCVNGDSNQNAQPANQRDGSSDVETFAFLQGKQLDNECNKSDDRENDWEDHEGLRCFEGRLIVATECQRLTGVVAIHPESPWDISKGTPTHHPNVGNGGDEEHDDGGNVNHKDTSQ